jgi:hypothetical protein
MEKNGWLGNEVWGDVKYCPLPTVRLRSLVVDAGKCALWVCNSLCTSIYKVLMMVNGLDLEKEKGGASVRSLKLVSSTSPLLTATSVVSPRVLLLEIRCGNKFMNGFKTICCFCQTLKCHL